MRGLRITQYWCHLLEPERELTHGIVDVRTSTRRCMSFGHNSHTDNYSSGTGSKQLGYKKELARVKGTEHRYYEL